MKNLTLFDETTDVKNLKNFTYGLHKKLWDLRGQYGSSNVSLALFNECVRNFRGGEENITFLTQTLAIVVNGNVHTVLKDEMLDYFEFANINDFQFVEEIGAFVIKGLADYARAFALKGAYFKGCRVEVLGASAFY